MPELGDGISIPLFLQSQHSVSFGRYPDVILLVLHDSVSGNFQMRTALHNPSFLCQIAERFQSGIEYTDIPVPKADPQAMFLIFKDGTYIIVQRTGITAGKCPVEIELALQKRHSLQPLRVRAKPQVALPVKEYGMKFIGIFLTGGIGTVIERNETIILPVKVRKAASVRRHPLVPVCVFNDRLRTGCHPVLRLNQLVEKPAFRQAEIANRPELFDFKPDFFFLFMKIGRKYLVLRIIGAILPVIE